MSSNSDFDDSNAEDDENDQVSRGRRNIRQVKTLDELSLGTRIAHQSEEDRIQRISAFYKRFNETYTAADTENTLILDFDPNTKQPVVSVHPLLVKDLKPHQKEGVRFMWTSCFETVEQARTTKGSGCVLAHCMGLGKTFQIISLIHTLLQYPQLLVKNILICCPKNTVLNWVSEFNKWITPELGNIKIFNIARFENNAARYRELKKWQLAGGVGIINYEMFRILLNDMKEDPKQNFVKVLLNPGPDVVVCDEGHVLKNEDTKLSKVMSRMQTMRRIVLTGTPMQNNLREYHCMVHFVKPNLLGSRTEFLNMFVNPILNGQYHNSELQDVQLMKERSHILHKTLSGCVQRHDLSTLKKYLHEKQEYVIAVRLTTAQEWMYQFYLGNFSEKATEALFVDYQSLQRVWTHPYTLKLHMEKHDKLQLKPTKKKQGKKKKRRSQDSDDQSSGDDRGRYPLEWWTSFLTSEGIQDARSSNKLILLLDIIRHCEDRGEKLLVFSGSLYTLNMIEHFLLRISHSDFEVPELCEMSSTWETEEDYFVMTGSTSADDRARYCSIFNNSRNARARLFLISTKAGGLGINLTAANRAVIFDAQWNPSHDIQSIFRIYRLGQDKTCFVYRFLVSGTMEEKIYERQVTKQSISHRVVDEKQIARHYTLTELKELYQLDLDRVYTEPTHPPRDQLMAAILEKHRDLIAGYHEHDSLLEHKEDEELQEVDKTGAWNSYTVTNNLNEDESAAVALMTPDNFRLDNFIKVLRRKYPNADDDDIKSMTEELMPQVNQILAKPDFNEIMRAEAVRDKHKKECLAISKSKVTVTQQGPGLNFNKQMRRSCGIGHRRPQLRGTPAKNPLNVWGTKGGIDFGTPDTDSP